MQLIKEKTPARFTYVGLIFVNPTYGEQRAGDKPIRERWCRILLVAGVRDQNPYQTRHTFASSLLMLGANPLYVATQLGHVDTALVFRTYGRWIGSDQRSAIPGHVLAVLWSQC